MNILIIEPDKGLGKIYSQALEMVGHDVSHAQSGQQAIMMADAETPDLILIEWQMSEFNGIAFLQEFRSYHEWKDVPVALLTYAHPSQYVEEQEILLRDYGISRWLYKPQTSLEQLQFVAASFARAI